MLTLDEIKTKLSDRNLKAVAAASGVNYETLRRIVAGDVKDPRFKTLKSLSDYLAG